MRKMKRGIVVLIALSIMTISSMPVFAYSSSSTVSLPGGSYKVQANVWQSNTYFWQNHSFAVSAKLYTKSGATTKATTIKTTWSFSATGVGLSISGVSGATGGGNFSGSWTNSNAWISDMSGSFKIGGAPLYSNFNNTAFALKSGVKAQATASCFRFY